VSIKKIPVRTICMVILTLTAAIATGALAASNRLQKSGATITAQKLVLSNPKARTRIEIGIDDDGSAGFRIFAADDKRIAAFGMNPDGSLGLVLFDTKGGSRVALGTDANGLPHFALADEKGIGGVFARLQPDGSAGVGLTDGNSTVRSAMYFDPAAGGQVQVVDERGRPHIFLGAADNGAPTISVFSRQGKKQVELGSGRSGYRSVGFATIYGTDEQPRIDLGVFDEAPALLLKGDDQRVRLGIGVRPQGSTANVTLYDLAGKERLRLGAPGKGTPRAECLGDDGRNLWAAP
jgi:hypothetical protein